MNTEPQALTQSEENRVRHIQQLSTNRLANVAGLISMLVDPSWVVRRAVVDSLALAGDAAVEALCTALMASRDSEARIAATVDALVGSIGNVDETLLKKIVTASEPAFLADVAQILGRRRSHLGIPKLIELAQNSDDNVAVMAIEGLGRIGGRSAVEALISATKSDNFFRTFAAIDVLGRSEDPRVVAPLTVLLENPSYAPEASRALARTGEKSAAKSLLKHLSATSDASVRLAALNLWDLRVRFSEKSGGVSEPIDEVISEAVNGQIIRRMAGVFRAALPAEAVAICRIIGVTKNPEGASILVMALQSVESVATAAAESLKSVGPQAEASFANAIRTGDSQRRRILLPSVSRLTDALEVVACLADEDSEVRALACDALGRIGNVAVVSQIFEALEDSNPRVVYAATAAIQALGSRLARELAVKSCKSANKNVRRAGLRIMGYFGDESALESMINGLTDTDMQVREAAIQGLPYIEGTGALDALLDASRSESDRVRALTMRSLGQVPKFHERVVASLLRGLKDNDAWVRYYAVQALGRIAYAAAAEDLESLLNDPAGQVRVAVVESLSKLGTNSANMAIRRAANSPEIDVRRAALLGMGLSHHSEDLPILIKACADDDASTRLMALSSLVSFNSSAVVEVLRTTAYDSDEQVSSAAINFLAGRPELDATEVLVDLLKRATTQEKAKTALLIPSAGRVGGLLIALEDAHGEIVETLTAILARVDRFSNASGLQAAIKLNNANARKAAASAIAARRDLDLRFLLEEAAQLDPNPEVRAICLLLMED